MTAVPTRANTIKRPHAIGGGGGGGSGKGGNLPNVGGAGGGNGFMYCLDEIRQLLKWEWVTLVGYP